jgi:hypothetical protein
MEEATVVVTAAEMVGGNGGGGNGGGNGGGGGNGNDSLGQRNSVVADQLKLESNAITSVPETPVTDLVKIYPNPNQGQFIVQKPINMEVRFRLLNSLGQVITDKLILSDIKQIEIDVARGLYYGVLQLPDGRFSTVKIVVE